MSAEPELTGGVAAAPVHPPGKVRLPRLRWWLAVFLFGSAVLNYVDRQALSLLAPTIQQELGFGEQAYANIVNLFLVAYTLAYLGSGAIVDRFGARWSLALFVVWWSTANILTALARSAASLGVFRFMLGLGEAGNWLAAPKIVARWFPAHERGVAIGLYTLGATIGATIAPILVLQLAGRWGWQGAFVVTGALGLAWVVPWLWIAREPDRNPLVPAGQKQALDEALARDAAAAGHGGEVWTWGDALSRPEVWRLLLARLLTDPVWYFYQFWFAKYLFADRAVTQKGLAITWLIFLAADIGTLAGGIISGRMVRRGAAPAAARLRAMLVTACVVPLSVVVPWADSVPLVLALSAAVVLAHMSWLTNLGAMVVDIVPERSLGRVFGIVAAGSSVGGIIMNTVVAAMVSGPAAAAPAGFLDRAIHAVFGSVLQLVQGQGYASWFLVMAFLHPLAWLLLRFGPARKPIK
ncbi:MAG: MFS transporter [Opitutaceae bacterium]|nr:MFS transporter [Opitutaceae bacterium]